MSGLATKQEIVLDDGHWTGAVRDLANPLGNGSIIPELTSVTSPLGRRWTVMQGRFQNQRCKSTTTRQLVSLAGSPSERVQK